ncbi:hypothetical protein WR25_26116 [Diploscapter pachys]|uniref:MD-2-related lipid-recognition domain-containing protein n=1 Tax=Diploscapter pachys TaxID=2018661 RepID=A0A2A2J621_9BILA|nr:hypothetical protein WR25_26116 [Diploscapter pachys]
MLRNLIFLGLIGICLADCPAWPNKTDTQINWWPCSSGPVIFSDVNQTDCNGNYEYPIHLAKPLLIVTQADNQGHVYSSPGLKQTINFWEWNDSTCTWTAMPTFGLLKNLDACTNGVKCPIQMGKQTLTLELDFSDVESIIKMLKDDWPYQLQYILHDDPTGDQMCLMFQARAYVTN